MLTSSDAAVMAAPGRRSGIASIKAIFQNTCPGLYEWLRFRIGHPAIMQRITAVVAAQSGGKVMAGPFEGMICGETVTGSHVPKMLGCYEMELHSAINEIIAAGYSQIVDVGCGEGYYAVGLALRIPAVQVFGFDTDHDARAACADQARRNNVESRVKIAGACNTVTLRQTLPSSRSLVISDCEGYEAVLLDPEAVPQLRHSDILVELHELFSPGVTKLLTGRFMLTHSIVRINSACRSPNAYPVLSSLSNRHRAMAVSESRYGPMQWLWMRANCSATAA